MVSNYDGICREGQDIIFELLFFITGNVLEKQSLGEILVLTILEYRKRHMCRKRQILHLEAR